MENRKARYPECYRREALESWKAEGVGNGFGRELDAWQWNDLRAGEHGSIKWSGGGMDPGHFWMETRRYGKEVIEVEDKGAGDVDF